MRSMYSTVILMVLELGPNDSKGTQDGSSPPSLRFCFNHKGAIGVAGTGWTASASEASASDWTSIEEASFSALIFLVAACSSQLSYNSVESRRHALRSSDVIILFCCVPVEFQRPSIGTMRQHAA